jgi:long-chain acyl-CoA synthetase
MKNVFYESKEYNNIKDVIRNSYNTFAENNAFIIKNKNGKEITYTNITYKKMYEDMNALGTALIELGLKNERIAIIGKNRYEWALSYISILNGTGIVVPLDVNLPEQEIISSLQRSKAKSIIFDKKIEDVVIKIKKEKSTDIEKFICMDDIKKAEIIKLSDLIEKGKKKIEDGNREYINAEIDDEKMSIILFTSGTSSRAKAVMLSHKNIASNIFAMNSMVDFRSTDINFVLLPLHHTFGSTGLLLMLSKGACNVFCDGLKHIQENMKEYKVSTFIGVPLILESMHKKIMAQIKKQNKERKICIARILSKILLLVHIDIRRKIFKQIIDNLGGNIRLIVSGAAGIEKKVVKDFNDFGIQTIQGYGLTETSPVLCGENVDYVKTGSVGWPMCNIELKINNPNEKGIGEIIAKGPSIMLGYYDDIKSTEEVLVDGWFHTGDLGYIDNEGYVYITGRKKNVIVLKNGKNIYPEELEILINKLLYVSESMVFGYPKENDLIVTAKIVYNREFVKNYFGNISKDELKEKIWEDIKKINKTLANYKHIKKIIITEDEMIKTTTAKIKRYKEIEKILSEKK